MSGVTNIFLVPGEQPNLKYTLFGVEIDLPYAQYSFFRSGRH